MIKLLQIIKESFGYVSRNLTSILLLKLIDIRPP